jgi:beta-galactosidase
MTKPVGIGHGDGVSCYASTDLVRWEKKPFAVDLTPLGPVSGDCRIERPKVLHCKKTGKFVMIFKLFLDFTHKGRGDKWVAVAVAPQPTGPFVYQTRWRPLEPSQPGDFAVLQEEDGTVYHVVTLSDKNFTVWGAKLKDDYSGPVGAYQQLAGLGRGREGLALCEWHHTYYMLGSSPTGYKANRAFWASSPALFGPWTVFATPCQGVNAANGLGPEKTFGGQSSFILPLPHRSDAFMALFDNWEAAQTEPKTGDRRNYWLPLLFTPDGKATIPFRDHWNPLSP